MIYPPASKPEDWKQLLADPQKHWKKGYSARSLAYCWQKAGGIPRDVKDVLLQLPDFQGLETLLVFPPSARYPYLAGKGHHRMTAGCWQEQQITLFR